MSGTVKPNAGFSQRLLPSLSGDMTAGEVRATLRHCASGGPDRWMSQLEARCRQITRAAGLNPNLPGYRTRLIAEGSELDRADRILRRIKILRSATAEMNLSEVIWQAVQIERETNEYDFLIDHGPTIQRGRAFEHGPKGKRDDALSMAIKSALGKLGGSATAKEVLELLKSDTTVVQEIDEKLTIYWKSTSCREYKTTFKSFQNRLSKLKKLIRA
jgi:hypothetical protein